MSATIIMQSHDDHDARLQRIPAADGLDPTGFPPGLAWHARTMDSIDGVRHRITVPCVLAAPPLQGVDRSLTDELRRRWVAGAPRHGAWQITDVVAAFDRPERSTHLTLSLTASPRGGRPSRALDDARMGRDLDLAVTRSVRAAGALR